MDHRQGQGREEGQKNLYIHRAVPHPLLHPQPGEDGIALLVVRGLGQLLEGQHRRRAQQKDNAQINAQKQDDDFGTHGLLVDVQLGRPAVDVAVVDLLLLPGYQLAHGLCQPVIGPLGVRAGGVIADEIPLHTKEGDVRGPVRQDHIPLAGFRSGLEDRTVCGARKQCAFVDLQHRARFIHRIILRLLQGPQEQAVLVLPQPQGLLTLELQQAVAVRLEEHMDRYGQVLSHPVQLRPAALVHQIVPQLLRRVEAVLRQPPLQVGRGGPAAGEELHRHIVGGRPVGDAGNGVVQADGAGGDADGQQEHQTDDRHGHIGAVNPGIELPEDEHIQAPVVHPLGRLAQFQQEARQGPEKQQGPQAPQAQHHEEQGVDGQNPPPEQHGVGDGQQRGPRQEHDQGGPDAFELQVLVFPVGVEQVNELLPGDGEGVEEHHHQEDDPKIQCGLQDCLQGEDEVELCKGNLKEPGGEDRDKLREHHPQRQPRPQGKQADEQGFQQQQAGHQSAVHTQEQVSPQLPLPAADHEAVGVENQKAQHHRHEGGEHVDEGHQYLNDVGTAGAQGVHDILGVHGVEYVKDAHAKGECEKIHRVVPHTADHVFQGQLREHRRSHLPKS